MNPALIAAMVTAGLQIGSGIMQKAQAKKRARGNVRPELGDLAVSEHQGLLDLFEQQAQYGMDPSTLDFIAGKNEDVLQSTFQSMLMAGGDPNAAGRAYRGYAESMKELGVAESSQRWDKIKMLAPLTEQLADTKLQRFLYDKDAPYKDIAQASAAGQNAGYMQMMAGFDTAASTAIKGMTPKSVYQVTPETPPTATTQRYTAPVETIPSTLPDVRSNMLQQQPGAYNGPDLSGANLGFNNAYPQLENWLNEQSKLAKQRN